MLLTGLVRGTDCGDESLLLGTECGLCERAKPPEHNAIANISSLVFKANLWTTVLRCLVPRANRLESPECSWWSFAARRILTRVDAGAASTLEENGLVAR